MMTLCSEITDYLDIVEAPDAMVNKEQKQLAALVRKAFETEDIYIDTEQLATYMSYQKYFPFELYPWEKFIFTLHNCTYWRDSGLPRWPILHGLLGRGAGKNGYMAFEAFCWISPANGIPNYDIELYATAEKQAMRSFKDVYDVLERNKKKLSKFFKWNSEVIICIKTNSKFIYCTSNPGTKDGGRPGGVMFDEEHAFENTKLMDVAITGLGKVKHPRRTRMSSQGNVRGAVLDDRLKKDKKILDGEIPDGGVLPFICRIESDEEIDDPKCWVKANPTLLYVGKSEYATNLYNEMLLEYDEYKDDPISHSSFATKRLNWPKGNVEIEVTSWDNVVACSRPIGDIDYKACIAAIDYASTQDFVSAGFLFLIDGEFKWLTKSWICKRSKTLSRIQFPYLDSEQRGECTVVDNVEIPPEIPMEWLFQKREEHHLNVICGAIDRYRYTIMSKALQDIGFIPEHKENGKTVGNLVILSKADVIKIAPELCLEFERQKIAWGEGNRLMQWYTNNVKKVINSQGNTVFEKIEPKSRKTDGFMALAAAYTQKNKLLPYDRDTSSTFDLGVWKY